MEINTFEYKKAIVHWEFDRYNDGNLYLKIIDSWKKNEIVLLAECPEKFKELLEDSIFVMEDLAINIFELFSASLRVEVNRQAINTCNLRLSHIDASFKEFKKYVEVIIVNVQKEQFKEAKFLQLTFLNNLIKLDCLVDTVGINLKNSPLKKTFKDAKHNIEEIKIPEMESFSISGNVKMKSFEDFVWFKVGLTFANGKAQELYEKYRIGKGIFVKGHFTKITKDLGFNPTDRPYFSETFSNNLKSKKNIFTSSEKMMKIFEYCQKNSIEITEDFQKHLLLKSKDN